MTEHQAASRPAGSTAGPDTDRVQHPQAPQRPQGPQRPQARPEARPEVRPPEVRPDGRQRPDPPQAPGALLADQDLEAVTRRWHDIQAGFVDAPQQAVKDADALVADLLNRLTQMFTAERRQLEAQWSQGDEVSTEDLRVGLQRYRTFFQRLLSIR